MCQDLSYLNDESSPQLYEVASIIKPILQMRTQKEQRLSNLFPIIKVISGGGRI